LTIEERVATGDMGDVRPSRWAHAMSIRKPVVRLCGEHRAHPSHKLPEAVIHELHQASVILR